MGELFCNTRRINGSGRQKAVNKKREIQIKIEMQKEEKGEFQKVTSATLCTHPSRVRNLYENFCPTGKAGKSNFSNEGER